MLFVEPHQGPKSSVWWEVGRAAKWGQVKAWNMAGVLMIEEESVGFSDENKVEGLDD